ncbi:MAG TPA: DnaT-like ssDNA-binding protein [Myxococcota bacterium]
MTRTVSVMLVANATPMTTATVTLSDEAATYGIRRADTDEVVIAAGTVVPHVGNGVYTYVFSDALAGVAYEARVKIEWPDGSIDYADRPLAAELPTITLPSYLTVEEANELATQLFGLDGWLSLADADRAKILPMASRRVDASRRWQGRKWMSVFGTTQALEFPRCDSGRLMDPSDDGTTAVVPLNVKLAVMYEADSIAAGDRDERMQAQHDGLVAQEIGTAREQYLPATAGGVPILCREADMLVKGYQLRTGRLL